MVENGDGITSELQDDTLSALFGEDINRSKNESGYQERSYFD